MNYFNLVFEDFSVHLINLLNKSRVILILNKQITEKDLERASKNFDRE